MLSPSKNGERAYFTDCIVQAAAVTLQVAPWTLSSWSSGWMFQSRKRSPCPSRQGASHPILVACWQRPWRMGPTMRYASFSPQLRGVQDVRGRPEGDMQALPIPIIVVEVDIGICHTWVRLFNSARSRMRLAGGGFRNKPAEQEAEELKWLKRR